MLSLRAAVACAARRWGLLGLAALPLACAGPAKAPPPLAAFVIMGPDGPVARVVTDAPHCPAVDIDGAVLRMSVRAVPNEQFPVLVCDAVIPPGAASVAAAGAALPLPKPGAARV